MDQIDVCRLCLKFEGVAFLALDQYRITKVKSIIPGLNLDINGSEKFMICTKCKGALDAAYNLRQIISDNEELIRLRKNKLNIVGKVTLEQIFNEGSSGSDVSNICRICLNSNERGNVDLENVPTDDSFYRVLQTCLTNMDRNLTACPTICSTCISNLCDMYSFINGSLIIEDKIKRYCGSDPETRNLDINKILVLLKDNPEKCESNNDFLSEFEIKDEEGADIFDNFTSPPSDLEAMKDPNNIQWKSEYNSNNKRPSEESNEAVPYKKPKYVIPNDTDEITGEELPHFKFNFQLLHNSNLGITLEDWLDIVDIQKRKHHWSDNMTIQKVLLRMHTLSELQSWFSSIGDILTWDEWKNKLLQAFPTPDDYCLSLKKAINRKRKPTETYVEYFKEKVKLLDGMGIVGQNAISCLVHGLVSNDVLVYCLARIGNYSTTEELLEYLKKCDEKQSVADNTMKMLQAGAAENKIEAASAPKAPGSVLEPAKSKPVIPSMNKNNVEIKRFKGKCFICLKPGHQAFACTATSLPKIPGAIAKPIQTWKKIKPLKCRYCDQYGHKQDICPQAKFAELRRLQAETQGTPAHTSQPARCAHCGETSHASFQCPRPNKFADVSTDKKKQKVQCGYCRKYGHTYEQCSFVKKKANMAVEKATAKASQQYASRTAAEEAKRHKSSPEARCSYCGSSAHLRRNCSSRMHGKADSERRDRSEREACYHCGSLSHLPSACYYSKIQEDSYRKANEAAMGSAFKQLLCFNCYKIGHQTEECPRQRGLSYRN